MQSSSAEQPEAPCTAAAPLRIYRRDISPGATRSTHGLPGNPRDEQLLIDAVTHFSGRAAADVVITRHCRRCGGDDHGKPFVRVAGGTDDTDDTHLQVSLSRAGGQMAVAVSSGHPIGLDIADPGALGHASIDAAALHPAELSWVLGRPEAERDDIRTLLWSAKEAVLKATGWGLAIDPSALEFALSAEGQLTLETWPSSLELDEPPYVGVLELPATTADRHLLGVIAVIGQRPTDVDIWRS